MEISLFSQPVILEDDAVMMRPLTVADYENLLPFSLNEQDLWKFSLMQPIGEEGLRNYLQAAKQEKEAGKEYPFIVFDKKKNKYAGSTRFYDIQPKNNSLQLGYTWYGKEHQGTGLNKRCKSLLLEFAFEKLGVARVEFQADNSNARSIAAMKSIGCTVEGVLRSYSMRPDGSRRDTIVLSILANEWPAIKKRLSDKIPGKL